MSHFWLFLKGFAMGAANVIPGVSGGTIAFITGIYFRLIEALKRIDLEAIRLFFTGRWKDFAERIDLAFLVVLGLGVGVSLLSLAKVMTWALTNYEIWTMAFFFGLILASILGVGRQISHWTSGTFVAFAVGTSLAIGVAFLPPAQPNAAFIYLLVCGMVAICSMILPGLSGSYILLLMGNYVLVLEAIGDLNLSILAPVGIGVILGLVGFSRLLSWLFSTYKNQTIALLTGFVAGSLLIIWPWKKTILQALPNGKSKAVGYDWFLPALDGAFWISLLFVAVGFLLVYMIDRKAPEEV